MLDESINWRVVPPESVKRGQTPDVLVALLKEDPFARKKCQVLWTLNLSTGPLAIPLARVVLRPITIPLINEAVTHRLSTPRKERLAYEVNAHLRTIKRVVFLDKDHTNCRRENLREISAALYDEPSEEI